MKPERNSCNSKISKKKSQRQIKMCKENNLIIIIIIIIIHNNGTITSKE